MASYSYLPIPGFRVVIHSIDCLIILPPPPKNENLDIEIITDYCPVGISNPLEG